MLTVVGDVLLFDGDTLTYDNNGNPLQTQTQRLWAHNLTNGSTWPILPSIIAEVGNGFSGFETSDTLYFAGKVGSYQELWAYNIVNQTAWGWSSCDNNGTVQCGLQLSDYHSVAFDGVLYYAGSYPGYGLPKKLTIFNPPLPITSSSSSGGGSGSGGSSSGGSSSGGSGSSGTPGVSWSTQPALPAGMSISNGEISGTPSVYATNQTYTIYANQSGYSTTHELYFLSLIHI